MTKEDIKAAAETEATNSYNSSSDMYLGKVAAFIAGAEHVLKEMEWKDVTKELPEEETPVLLVIQMQRENGNWYKGATQGIYEAPLFYSDHKNGIRVALPCVTHWSKLFPLPQ